MTRSGMSYAPKDFNRRVLRKEQNPKKNFIDTEFTEFWKKMQLKDYSVKEIPESIITDNVANLNSDLMKEIWERFKISYGNSIVYRPQMNEAVENIYWGNSLYVGLCSEVVIPAQVEIPSLRIIQEVGLDDAKWIHSRIEQLMIIDEKRMDAVCYGQLYQNRMAKAFNKKVKPRQFTPGQLVLKNIFPHQREAKGKFAPNLQGPYMVHRVLSRGAVILVEMDGTVSTKPINSDAIKKYYI
ncbi:uncharacterized protein LOC129869775 [Solanum dulcamara]|uniref:uncharacterized protein LOC129869775 n=1 Tax=Solanum dulcamara TaxID=45834 RepID=UPI0024868E62|nr:uncharacterized protein LOC129869775 [Solanum dulcamara]